MAKMYCLDCIHSEFIGCGEAECTAHEVRPIVLTMFIAPTENFYWCKGEKYEQEKYGQEEASNGH